MLWIGDTPNDKKGKRENQGVPFNDDVSPRGNERTSAPRTSPPARRP